MSWQPFRKLNFLQKQRGRGRFNCSRNAASPRSWSDRETPFFCFLSPGCYYRSPPARLWKKKKVIAVSSSSSLPQRQTQRKEGTLSQSIGFTKPHGNAEKPWATSPRCDRVKALPSPPNSDSDIIPIQREQVLLGGGGGAEGSIKLVQYGWDQIIITFTAGPGSLPFLV